MLFTRAIIVIICVNLFSSDIFANSTPKTELHHAVPSRQPDFKSQKRLLDAELLAAYASFSAGVWVAATDSADSAWNEKATGYAIKVSETAWKVIRKNVGGPVTVWEEASENVQALWKKNPISEEVFNNVLSMAKSYHSQHSKQASAIAKSLAYVIDTHPDLFKDSSIDVFAQPWKGRLTFLNQKIQRIKKERAVYNTAKLNAQKPWKHSKRVANVTNEEAEELMKAFTKGELKKGLNIEESTKNFMTALDGKASLGALNHDYLKAVLEKIYSKASDPLINKPVELLFSSKKNENLKELSLRTVQNNSEYVIGDAMKDDGLDVIDYFRELRDNGSGILYEVATNPAAQVASSRLSTQLLGLADKSDVKTPTPFPLHTTILKNFVEGIISEGIQFSIDGVAVTLYPTKPLKKPLGYVVKDGMQFYVMPGRDPTEDEVLALSLIEEKGEVLSSTIEKMGYKVGPKVQATSGVKDHVWKFGSYLTQKLYDVSLSAVFLKGTDYLPKPSEAHRHKGFFRTHTATRAEVRLKKFVDRLVTAQFVRPFLRVLGKYQDIVGVTKIDGAYYYVYRELNAN